MRTISRWLSQEFHAWLAGVISWQERALAILNGPGLQYAALGAAFVMRVPWLQRMPGLDIAYTCLVLLGVDMQYIACWHKAKETTGKQRILWVVVALALSLPVFQTNAVFTLHSQTGIDEVAAMGMIWLTSTQWAIECAVYLVILIAVSALSRPRHHTPALALPAPAPTPSPAPTAPDKPDKPKGTRTRRDTGRTVEEREALKRRIRPTVVAMSQRGLSHQAIADKLSTPEQPVTKFTVQQIIRDEKNKQQQQRKGA